MKGYLKLCCDYNNNFNNTKYNIMKMLSEREDTLKNEIGIISAIKVYYYLLFRSNNYNSF